MLTTAMALLNEREKRIITMRRLEEDAMTLEELNKEYECSRKW